MKIFLANAKAALLQVKTPALLGGVFLLLFWLWVFRDEDSDFVLLLFLGCVGGSGPFSTVRREIATRPFSFCLPRYRESLYEAVLCEAVLAGAAISLIGSRLAEERIPFNIGLWASGGFLVGTSLFLFGATARLIPALVTPVFDVVLSLPFCVAALAMLIVIAMYPPMFWFVGIAICAAIVTFVWVRFADRAAVMQAHRDLVTDAIKRHAPFVIEKPAYAWRERFFFDRIDRCRYLCAGRFLWGYLYCTFRHSNKTIGFVASRSGSTR